MTFSQIETDDHQKDDLLCKEQTHFVITFTSTHQAIKFERMLLPNFDIELIPTPREVSASCGLSLKFLSQDRVQLLGAISSENKQGIQLYMFTKNENHYDVKPLKWED